MESSPQFTDKTVVVTGATSGIGLQAAREFAARGAFVIGVGRSAERCQQAATELQSAYPYARVRYLVADLSLQRHVRRLAENIGQEVREAGKAGLDVLVNNAGTYAGKFIRTADGAELTFAVNHLAPFLLTNQLLPLLQAAPFGRVITISSGSHYRTCLDVRLINHPLFFIGLWEYKVSKLANVLFTLEFNRRMAGSQVRAFAVDPGLVNTEIGLKGTDWLSRTIWQMRRSAGVNVDVPVRTILYVASETRLQTSPHIYWYDCHPVTPSRQAQRADLARKLWKFSSQLCGIN